MTDIKFFDNDAVVRLGEAILSQLQMDYVKAYIKYLKYGDTAEIYHYGKGWQQRCVDSINEMEKYIRSSMLTADKADAIIFELRRQAKVAVSKGKSPKKALYRRVEEPRFTALERV